MAAEAPFQGYYQRSKIYQSQHNKGKGSRQKKRTADDPYGHDIQRLLLRVEEYRQCCKILEKLQKDIFRKRKLAKSKQLSGKMEEYRETLLELHRSHALNEQEYQSNFPDEHPEAHTMSSSSHDSVTAGASGDCPSCFEKEKQMLRLQSHVDTLRMSGEKRKSDVDRHLEEALQRIADLTNLIEHYQIEGDDVDKHYIPIVRYQQLQQTLALEKQDKEDALRGLSKVAFRRQRDNYPNITDFSDENRPTKLGEKLTELYDNEWTDAFDVLMEQNHTERDSIKILLKTLMNTFEVCQNEYRRGMDQIKKVLKCEEIEGSNELLKTIKDYRKANVDLYIKDFKLEGKDMALTGPASESKEFKVFSEKCATLCWYMVVQDPPLSLYIPGKGETELNSKLFREYTKRGRYFQYVVWPTLLLYEGGPVLAKGVTQGGDAPGYNEPSQSIKPTGVSRRYVYADSDVSRQLTEYGNVFSAEMEAKKNQFGTVQESLEQMEAELKQQLENERQIYVEQENKWLAELTQKTEIIDELKAELQLKQWNLQDMKTMIQKLQAEVQEEKKAKNDSLLRLQDQRSTIQRLLAKVQEEKKAKNDALFRIEYNNEELGRQIQTLKTEKDQANKEWKERTQSLEKTKEKLTNQLEIERKAYVELENKSLAELKQKSDINDDLNAELQRIQNSGQDKNSEIQRLRAELQEERKTRDDALLRDKYPDITELSDENRPSKIGEKMGELYDNEWINAFEELEGQHGEIESIKLLLQIFQETYRACSKNAKQQMEQVIAVISDGPNVKELLNFVKDARKQRINAYVEQFKEAVDYSAIVGPVSNTNSLKLYIDKCMKTCWMMVVQDPPLCLHESQVYEKFDSNVYREYTQRGPFLQFVVLPTVLLYDSGPVLAKGVAQGGHKAAPPQDGQ